MVRRVALIIAAAAAACVLMSSQGPAAACSLAAPAGAVVGEVVRIDGGGADLIVEQRTPYEPTSGRSQPELPRVGARVHVAYEGDEEFLRVGRRYSVTLRDVPKLGWFSGVHTAEEVCGGGGTVYADGAAIDTALWSRDEVRRGAVFLAIGVGVVSVTVIGLRAYLSRRTRSTQRLTTVDRPSL